MSIGGVFAMLEFLSEYAPVIIAAAVLAALVIILAKKGMEYMMKSKGYRVPVHLSDIKLRY